MRVLFVARFKNGHYAPFITEQVEAVQKLGVDCKYFGITGKGIVGYLLKLPGLMKAIREYHPDLIHAHYGLCGLFANCQRRVPVITTYHGSDINDRRVLWLSQKAIRLSRFNIFVSQKNIDIAKPESDFALIPCGIDLDDYPLIEKTEARRIMGLDLSKKYILFAGSFDNPVKNAPLAQEAVKLVPETLLLELKGYTRSQVATLMQAVDVLLMTSITEGSPQVVKEALACGCPIVSVDVGDVKERIEGVDGCYISERDAKCLSENIIRSIAFNQRTDGRVRVEEKDLTNMKVAEKVLAVYSSILV